MSILRRRAVKQSFRDRLAQLAPYAVELPRYGRLVLAKGTPDFGQGELVHVIAGQEHALARGEAGDGGLQSAIEPRKIFFSVGLGRRSIRPLRQRF